MMLVVASLRSCVAPLACAISLLATGCRTTGHSPRREGAQPEDRDTRLPTHELSVMEARAIDAQMHHLLSRKIDFHVSTIDLHGLVGDLARTASLNIIIHPDVPVYIPSEGPLAMYVETTAGAAEAGDRRSRFVRITVDASDRSVADILDLVCAQTNLRWVYPDPDVPEDSRHGFIYLRGAQAAEKGKE